MQRSLVLFQNSIHSKETLRVYQYSLDKFLKYFKLRDYDSLARMDSKMLQTMVEDYVMAKILENFIEENYRGNGENIFSVNSRTIQNNFKLVSEKLGIQLTPHMLRSVFTEKCTIAKIPDKYIDALCGRTSPSIIAKHYTDYSPEKLRLQYNLVEPLLTL